MATGKSGGEIETLSADFAGTDQITIRKCDGISELDACVALQKEVWNFDDVDLVPLRMFVVSQKIGGQVIGAFDGDELVGFAFSIPAAAPAIPICIRTCWRCGNHFATTAWDGG